MSKKNLILPEKVVIELMALASRLGEIAVDYNKKIGGGRLIGEACHFVDLVRFLVDSKIRYFPQWVEKEYLDEVNLNEWLIAEGYAEEYKTR